MQSCILNHWSTRQMDDMHYLVLSFPLRPWSGLVGEADSTPIKFTSTVWISWNLIIIILFYKVYSNTLDICLRWLLIRVLSGHSLEGSDT